jgi:hypothetical protein
VDDPDDTKDIFKWKWKGATTAFDDFRDPLDGTPTLRVCVYDAANGTQPLAQMQILPGETCAGKPCWKELGGITPVGYKYKNKSATLDGLTDTKLRAGVVGRAQVAIKGKGVNLPTPPLGLTLPVTIQLLIGDGVATECWQTTYATFIKNDGVQFKAKGP